MPSTRGASPTSGPYPRGGVLGRVRARFAPPRSPRARRVYARLGAVVAGGLAVFVFPQANAGWLAWVVLVPWLLLLREAPGPGEAALRGWLGGVGYLAATQYWLLPNLVFFFPLAVALLGLLWIPWGVLAWAVLHGRVGPGRAMAALAGLPAGWVLIEAARSWQWLGGPWAVLGASQWRYPTVLGLAAVGGVWLVGFALVAVNVAVVLLRTRHRTVVALAGTPAVPAGAAGPVWYAAHADPPPSGSVRVALVQPGVHHSPEARLDAGIALTEDLAADRDPQAVPPDLVVWGESSVGFDFTARPDVLARLTALSGQVGAPLLVNVDAPRPGGGIAKVSVLLDEAGVIGRYAKVRLVPFGEYIPFRDQLRWIGDITEAAENNRERGPGPVVLRTRDGGLAIGPLVSFETTFPDMSRVLAARGADLLVSQTSMSTFQDSWAPAQMASLGAVRAAETGRPVALALLSGVSAAFDARGRPRAWLPADARGTLTAELYTTGTRTPYDRFGDYVPVVCPILLVPAVACLVGTLRRRPSRFRATGGRARRRLGPRAFRVLARSPLVRL